VRGEGEARVPLALPLKYDPGRESILYIALLYFRTTPIDSGLNKFLGIKSTL